jgi:hypothetical protein
LTRLCLGSDTTLTRKFSFSLCSSLIQCGAHALYLRQKQFRGGRRFISQNK